jgi:hypothetical protein
MAGTDRVRIEWSGFDDMPPWIRAITELEVGLRRDACRRMRAMSVEQRADESCRLSCRCVDPTRQLCVTRPTVGAALVAFEDTQRARCGS